MDGQALKLLTVDVLMVCFRYLLDEFPFLCPVLSDKPSDLIYLESGIYFETPENYKTYSCLRQCLAENETTAKHC